MTGPRYLRQQLNAHLSHLRREVGGQPLELRGEELRRLSIEDFDFEAAIMSGNRMIGCSFAGSRFRGARLSATKFVRCDLSGCDFSGANLQGISIQASDLSFARLAGAGQAPRFEVGIDGKVAVAAAEAPDMPAVTDFSDSDLSFANLSGAQLAGATCRNVNLEGAVLADADLTGADLRGANLRGAKMIRAKLDGADLEGAVFALDAATRRALGDNPQFQRFVRAHDELMVQLDAHKTWVDSNGKTGQAAHFRGQVIAGVDFGRRRLAAVDFSGVTLRACKFVGCELAAANLTGAVVSFCDFDGADARGAILDNADFRFCSFGETDFGELELRGGRLKIAASVNGTHFAHCNLRAARLTHDQLRLPVFLHCQR